MLSYLSGALLLALGVSATVVPTNSSSTLSGVESIFVIVAGDSTSAKITEGGGGWAPGFLPLLISPSDGINFARNGMTTVSFRQKGEWAKVIKECKAKSGGSDKSSARRKSRVTVRSSRPGKVYVTIQFGHNDQKPEKGISVAQFRQNLETMTKEVTQAGCTPILLTSLTRRNFNKAGKLEDSLKPQVVATEEAARNTKTMLLPLNAASMAYIRKIGESGAKHYNLKPKDNTHLNRAGSKVFGRMVADLLVEQEPGLAKFIKKNPKMTADIKAGKVIHFS